MIGDLLMQIAMLRAENINLRAQAAQQPQQVNGLDQQAAAGAVQ